MEDQRASGGVLHGCRLRYPQVEKMRQKQRLHEDDRSDVVLQMLDDVKRLWKRQLTYKGWKTDVVVDLAELGWRSRLCGRST